LSIDVIERRRAVEERLRRARNLTQALDQATADLASNSGLTLDALDPEGSLRTAVTTLAGVAALRPGFDVLVSLPDLPFALRLRHLADDVDIALVRQDTTATDPTTPGPAPAITPAPSAAGLPEPRGSEAPESAEDAGGHVASDLAAMLWRDVGPPP
jgi:hypothetical protein